jgi:hypothetical protein
MESSHATSCSSSSRRMSVRTCDTPQPHVHAATATSCSPASFVMQPLRTHARARFRSLPRSERLWLSCGPGGSAHAGSQAREGCGRQSRPRRRPQRSRRPRQRTSSGPAGSGSAVSLAVTCRRGDNEQCARLSKLKRELRAHACWASGISKPPCCSTPGTTVSALPRFPRAVGALTDLQGVAGRHALAKQQRTQVTLWDGPGRQGAVRSRVRRQTAVWRAVPASCVHWHPRRAGDLLLFSMRVS